MHVAVPAFRQPRLPLLLLTTALVLAGCERPDPEQTRKRMGLPPAGFVADVVRGERLFGEFCVGCHGADARGTSKGPPLRDRIYRQEHHADLAFFRAIKDGVRQHHFNFGDMPPQPQVTPEQAADIIAWIRALQRGPG